MGLLCPRRMLFAALSGVGDVRWTAIVGFHCNHRAALATGSLRATSEMDAVI